MALIDARQLPKDHRIDVDLCVIGTGAAGLALAHAFEGDSRRVALLESGGLAPDPATAALNAGTIVGLADHPLDQTRLRFFGGTTNHWTAWVRPLEPIDFEQRPWIPHSGWPFGFEALAPYYERTRRFLDLPEHAFDTAAWADGAARPLRFEGEQVETRVLQVVPDPRRKLGRHHRAAIEGSKNVDVYLHANVLEIVPDEGVNRVRELRIGRQGGGEIAARAKRYVLAAGGIENARLLLTSTSVVSPGLGNAHDLVGRYFANHPEAGRAATLALTPAARKAMPFYWGRKHARGRVVGFLRLNDAIQREAKLPNAWLQPSFAMDTRRRSGLGSGLAALRSEVEGTTHLDVQVADALGQLDRALGSFAQVAGALPPIPLKIFVEPIPNPNSRVHLGADRDAFGQRRVILDWQLDGLDERHVRGTLVRFGRAIGASGLGRMRIRFPSAGFQAVEHRGSFHHMGTTRMHADPRHGVVDAQCQVHGLANLFVAGSSVFPSFGTANPTFTLLALAFRLADHLKGPAA